MSGSFYEQEIMEMINEDAAEDLQEKIVKQFEKLNCHISITKWCWKNERFIFRVKPKRNTREAHIRANAEDVRLRLKLSLFQVRREDNCLLLVVATETLKYPSLLSYLSYFEDKKLTMQLPYFLGHNTSSDLCLYDLAQFPHLLLGGATESGKSVGLQSLITGIAALRSPSEVNFVLIDVGASDLMFFEDLPHLSCPIIRSRENAIQALISLVGELERRVDLEYSNPEEWMRLPRLILIIDEFQALVEGGLTKDRMKSLTESVSSILQRGRHGKVHVILAAQNPTWLNMKVDMGNITVRAAFKCARDNNSKTIIGEAGAEKLAGHGEMLFQAPGSNKSIFVQGIFIDKEQIKMIVGEMKKKWVNEISGRFVIQLPDTSSLNTGGYKMLTDPVKLSPHHGEDEMFAKVLLWAFSHDEISINALMRRYGKGWNKIQEVVQKMTELGILSEQRAKLPRKVIPNDLSQLPNELIDFMENNGVDRETITAAFMDRYEPGVSGRPDPKSVVMLECKPDITDGLIKDEAKDRDEDKSATIVDSAKNSVDKFSGCEWSDERRTLKELFSDIGSERKKELERQKEVRKKLSSGHPQMLDKIHLCNCTRAIIWTLSQNYVSRRKLQHFFLKDCGRVDALIYRMEVWRVIIRTDDGLQWKVLPGCLNDLSDEVKGYLLDYGETEESLNTIFEQRVS